MMARIGSVASLWRYPVKSMLGEELDASEVTERGLAGDRAYALVDVETGRLASAKNPRKGARLLDFRATFVETPRAGAPSPPVRIALPDGTGVTSDREDLERVLSAAVGREVRFESSAPDGITYEEFWPPVAGVEPYSPPVADDPSGRVTETTAALGAPAGTFFDFSPIHLLTTSSMESLSERYPEGRIEAARFRPNILIECAERGFVENDWADRVLAIGDEVRVQVIVPVPRCVMITLPQEDLPEDSGILRALAGHNRIPVGPLGDRPCIGVYADVVRGGTIRRGDPITLE